MSFSGGGGQSESRERTTGWTTGTETPTYQAYATPIVEALYPQMQQAYGQTMADYLAGAGYNPQQIAAWQAVGERARGYGAAGPGGLVAEEYLQPTMGAGWMNQLDPYFQAQKQAIQGALPAENAAFWQGMKRQMGPL